MNEIALANFYRILNDADRYPKVSELAEAAIAAKDELNSLRAHPQPLGVPEGWVLVPREPTDEMLLAGAKADADQQYLKDNAWDRCVEEEYRREWLNGAKFSYKAMLSAIEEKR